MEGVDDSQLYENVSVCHFSQKSISMISPSAALDTMHNALDGETIFAIECHRALALGVG
jgi:hypothetical protein